MDWAETRHLADILYFHSGPGQDCQAVSVDREEKRVLGQSHI